MEEQQKAADLLADQNYEHAKVVKSLQVSTMRLTRNKTNRLFTLPRKCRKSKHHQRLQRATSFQHAALCHILKA